MKKSWGFLVVASPLSSPLTGNDQEFVLSLSKDEGEKQSQVTKGKADSPCT